MNQNGYPWPALPLTELASEMCLGKMLDKEKNRGTLQPYLRNVNVRWFGFDLSDLKEMRFEKDEEQRFSLLAGDLVICEGGEPGRAAVWKGESGSAKIQKALHRVRFRPQEYDSTFAMYFIYFGTITDRFSPHYTGTTIKHLTGKALSQVKFPVPPLNEQRRIVAKIEELFSKLDAGVAALKRAKANLKRYRAAVLKAAATGQLTAAWRAANPPSPSGRGAGEGASQGEGYEPAPKLLARILAARRQKWEQDQLAKFAAAKKPPLQNWQAKYTEPTPPDTTNLPNLPTGWRWVPMEWLADDVPNAIGAGPFGTIFKAKDFRPDGVPIIFLRHVHPGEYLTRKPGFMDRATWERLFKDEYSVLGGELLVTKLGEPPGTAAIYPHGIGPAMVTPDVIKMTPRRTAVFAEFLMHYMNSKVGQAFTSGVAFGTTRLRLTLPLFKEIPVPLPPVAEQAEIVAQVAEKLSQIEAAEATIDDALTRAARLRQSILHRAFSGLLVPQDPDDEPATALMERAGSIATLAAIRRPKVSKPRQRRSAESM